MPNFYEIDPKSCSCPFPVLFLSLHDIMKRIKRIIFLSLQDSHFNNNNNNNNNNNTCTINKEQFEQVIKSVKKTKMPKTLQVTFASLKANLILFFENYSEDLKSGQVWILNGRKEVGL